MSDPTILDVFELGFPWATVDPFLFCVHHHDRYPAGNEKQGPVASLVGRDLGQDFTLKDGWRMYHGTVVPGFPQHPHRGFETVTVVRQGLVDHSDSMGAVARYGGGDTQWLTAGKGIVHAEMFPLVHPARDNPLELFQIWLNLPRSHKFAEPHFAMFWNHQIPRWIEGDPATDGIEVTVIAGRLGDLTPPPPPPDSWAAREEGAVGIFTIRLGPGRSWVLPAARPGLNRALYLFRGEGLRVADAAIPGSRGLTLRSDVPAKLEAGSEACELVLLEGRPIGEPIAQYGPFVMNSRAEIQQAFVDYQRTGFGGWPWPSDDPVHPREEGRFARLADGRILRPES